MVKPFSMPRKHTKNRRWPPHVTVSKGRIVWRPYFGRENGKTLFGKEVVLFRHTDARDADVWDEYNRAANAGPTKGTVEWLLNRFLDSTKFKRLAERTQDDYRKYKDAIVSRKIRGGKRFGDVELTTISVRTINTYLSSASSAVQGNRQMAMMSSAWNWVAGEEHLPKNPIPGCRWNPEKARNRYVEDWEYDVVYKHGSETVKIGMELTYLCRLRKCELLALETLRDCRDDGLLARRRKGSRHQIIESSERLKAAIDAAKARHGSVTRFKLLVNKNGDGYTPNGWGKVWGDAMRKALASGDLQQSFTFHDLKRKGVSDFEGTDTEKLDSAGHKDKRTAEIYNVKPGKTRSTR